MYIGGPGSLHKSPRHGSISNILYLGELFARHLLEHLFEHVELWNNLFFLFSNI